MEEELGLTLTIEFTDARLDSIFHDLMDNYPEHGVGNAIQCLSWDYDAFKFTFEDQETEKHYTIDRSHLIEALKKMYDPAIWPRGCEPPPGASDEVSWDRWFSKIDVTEIDAFAQLACLGEIPYG